MAKIIAMLGKPQRTSATRRPIAETETERVIKSAGLGTQVLDRKDKESINGHNYRHNYTLNYIHSLNQHSKDNIKRKQGHVVCPMV